MKMRLLCCLLVLAPLSKVFGQKMFYTTTSGEWIFSFANISSGGVDASSVGRFSPVFNFQNYFNYDPTKHRGYFTGLTLRNVGFIYDVPNSNIRKKYRTYNIGIPIGIKVGNLDKTFLYGGYELEFAFNYKEKTFTNEEKTDKTTVWFSKQPNIVNSSLFAAVQLPHGASIKFKYYLSNFFNKNYTAQDASGNPYKPYQDTNVHIFYFSLNFFILKNAHIYYTDKSSSSSASIRR